MAAKIVQIVWTQTDGDPELIVRIRGESRRHHAGDGVTFAVEQNFFSEDLRVRRKAAFP
jgi:hypothetical protein